MTRLYATGTAPERAVHAALTAWHSHDRIDTIICADDDVGEAAAAWGHETRGVTVEAVGCWWGCHGDEAPKRRDEQAARIGYDRVLTADGDTRDFGSAMVRRVRG